MLAEKPVVEDLLGPDVVCFRCHYFCKLPSDVDAKSVTWHQGTALWLPQAARS